MTKLELTEEERDINDDQFQLLVLVAFANRNNHIHGVSSRWLHYSTMDCSKRLERLEGLL